MLYSVYILFVTKTLIPGDRSTSTGSSDPQVTCCVAASRWTVSPSNRSSTWVKREAVFVRTFGRKLEILIG